MRGEPLRNGKPADLADSAKVSDDRKVARGEDEIEIAILIYEGLTALDAIGPYEVLSRMPGARVTFVAEQLEPMRTDTGRLALSADATLAELSHPEIVLVPGGPGQVGQMDPGPLHDWLRAAHETSMWTVSVCTGSLILAGAGLLEGKRATSHWLALERLGELGAVPVEERMVFDGKILTAAGISAGIDMALALAARIAGEQIAESIQLTLEYDPRPPFDAGSPGKASTELVEAARSRSRFHRVGANVKPREERKRET
jgi:transcriptional regulator GlxA family with amidase domain